GLASVPASERDRLDSEYESACREYRHDDALKAVWRRIDTVNRQIEATKPWETLQAGDLAAVRTAVVPWLQDLSVIARQIEPFLPTTAGRIRGLLNANPLRTAEPLFPRRRAVDRKQG
ncbi:MAG: hypothetical protein JNM18_22585, partial [Planctomycetaceae bacterium]|nr:hypothetical protein [Planctomycetaceae bacterium]